MPQNFPIDIVIFAAIAIGLGWRLRTVLGRRSGAQPMVAIRNAPVRQRIAKVTERPAPEPQVQATLDIPAAGTRIGTILADMTAADSHVSPESFLREAEATFRSVVMAFAQGDRDRLRRFLTPDAYAAFDGAITARDSAGQTHRTEIRALQSLAIDDAVFARSSDTGNAGACAITVRIVSNQISVTSGADGQPVSGTDAVTEFSDLWRFERHIGPNASETLWRLAAARAA